MISHLQPLKIGLVAIALAVFSLLSLVSPTQGAVVYSGIQDLTVPNTIDGLYLNVATGGSTGTYPGDPAWNSNPYFNPFYGGVAIATSDLFLPVIMGASQVVNVAYNSLIDATQTYALGENGSSTHVGSDPGQFTLGTEGYVGFKFQATTGGPILFGWSRVVYSNTGSGMVRDWAYSDVAGQGIFAGTLTVVPEPSRALLLATGMLLVGWRRRRL